MVRRASQSRRYCKEQKWRRLQEHQVIWATKRSLRNRVKRTGMKKKWSKFKWMCQGSVKSTLLMKKTLLFPRISTRTSRLQTPARRVNALWTLIAATFSLLHSHGSLAFLRQILALVYSRAVSKPANEDLNQRRRDNLYTCRGSGQRIKKRETLQRASLCARL